MLLSHYNEILPFATTWMDLEDIRLSEIIQIEKDRYYTVHELFVVRWMDVESVIQSEVSQKEKNKYIYMESKKEKKGSEEPRGRTGIKMQQ